LGEELSKMRKFDWLVIIVMTFAIFAVLLLGGCEGARSLFGTHHSTKSNILPPSYDWTYVWIAGGSVIGIGIGVALAIILPGDDHVPYGIVGGCAAALVLCLVIGTIKAILTWSLVAGAVVGVLWVMYRLYKRASLETKIRSM
jgi:hypothetical protein